MLILNHQLDKHIIEKSIEPSLKKDLSKGMIKKKKVSVGRACRVVSLHRGVWCYQTHKDDSEVIAKLQSYTEQHPTCGLNDYYGKIPIEQ